MVARDSEEKGRRKGQQLTVGIILCIMIKALTYQVLSCVRCNYISHSLCQSSQASCEIGIIISKLQTGKLGYREIKQLTGHILQKSELEFDPRP